MNTHKISGYWNLNRRSESILSLPKKDEEINYKYNKLRSGLIIDDGDDDDSILVAFVELCTKHKKNLILSRCYNLSFASSVSNNFLLQLPAKQSVLYVVCSTDLKRQSAEQLL
jgi:hypothetical protein